MIGPSARSMLRTSAILAGAFLVALLMATPVNAAVVATPSPAGVSAPTPSLLMAGTGDASETGAAFGGTPVGPVAGSTATTVVIGIDVNDPTALLAFDAAVSDPSSPLYAHFLTQSEFVQEFGAPESVMQGLAAYLTGEGLDVVYESPDHIAIFATGTLSSVGPAFGTSFETYRDASGSTFWAATSAPTVPAAYAGWIISVAGLTDHPSDAQVELEAQGQSGGLLPAVDEGTGVLVDPIIHHQIYQLDQLYNATGNTSAGVEPSYATGAVITQSLWSAGSADCGYDTNDMNTFFNNSDGYAGGTFPKPLLEPHYRVPGYVTTGPEANTCADDELTLDIQHSGTDGVGATLEPTWVLGESGGGVTDAALEAGIAWIVANIPGLTDITQSWGGGEGGASSTFQVDFENAYATAISNGVTVQASSADDDGALGNGGCPSTGTPGVYFPGSSPLALSVGGTAIDEVGSTTANDDSDSSVWNWCDSGIGADGSQGGVSADYAEPSWQFGYHVNSSMQNAITYTNGHGGAAYSTDSAREVPDWAGPSACNTAYIDGAWGITGQCSKTTYFGGTSFASPSTAGLVAEMAAFDGHDFGEINAALYEVENTYLKGGPVLNPSYEVQNYSNLFFDGATDFNASAGWGMPLAYNLAQDLGKPFIATNPGAEPELGEPYTVVASVHDIQAISSVKVAYLLPGESGANWANLTLTQSSGSSTNGVWSGTIPGADLTTVGKLKYCVYATDVNSGNSWSPYNKSAWAATGSQSPTNGFGCTVPFSIYVKPGPLAGGTLTGNVTACEVNWCWASFNASFIPGTSPFTTTFMWNDGAGDKTVVSGTTSSPTYDDHKYTITGTFTVRAYVNDSIGASVSETTTLTVDPALSISVAVSTWHGGTPGNLTFTPTITGGSGTISTYSWTFTPYGNTSSSASPQQYYFHPGNFTVVLAVVDSLKYYATTTEYFSVWGNHSTYLTLYTGWNFVAIPTQGNDYTLYELSVLIGAPFVQVETIQDTTGTTFGGAGNSGNGNVAASPGEALWIDVTSGKTLSLFGTPLSSLAGEGYTASTWTSIGWSVDASTTAAGLAALIPGTEYISIWNAQTQAWETYIFGFSAASFGFTIQAGQAVQVWTTSTGTFTE